MRAELLEEIIFPSRTIVAPLRADRDEDEDEDDDDEDDEDEDDDDDGADGEK